MNRLTRFLHAAAVALGLILGGGILSWAALVDFTGPGGSNPINFTPVLSDLNTLINNITNNYALGNANATVGPGLNPSGRLYSRVGPVQGLATNTTGVTIDTYTIPFNAFDTGGRTMRAVYDFHTGTNFDAKSFGCGFASAIATQTVAATDGGKTGFGRCELTIVQGATANTVMVTGRLIYFDAGASITTQATASVPGTTITNSTTQSTAVYFGVGTPTNVQDVNLDSAEIFYDD